MSLDGENRFCTNCEHPVGGNFCANCGQSTKNIRISLAGLFSEVLDTYFNLNSKLFLSIKPLLFKPGQLTLAFIEGKRVSFLPPFRMYIVFSCVSFSRFPFSRKRLRWGTT